MKDLIIELLQKERCHYVLMKDYWKKQVDLSFPEQFSCEQIDLAAKKILDIDKCIEFISLHNPTP